MIRPRPRIATSGWLIPAAWHRMTATASPTSPTPCSASSGPYPSPTAPSQPGRGPQLAPDGGLGANGLKLHDGAVRVSNTQLGTLLRVPSRPDGSAGPIQRIATGLADIDDFAFTGPGPSAPVLAAINRFSTVVLIRPDGSQQTVLTAADGAVQPSSVALRGGTVYVLSAAYLTQTDPNILLASLHR